MQLRNRGVYRFNDSATSLYRGLEFIVDRTLHGCALYTATEWGTPGSDPHFVVDVRGRILRLGGWIGYTVEELTLISDAEPDSAPGHRPLDHFARPRRHHHGTTMMTSP